ncbi:transposase [Pseudomonas aeruginosa]|jgi:transposase
MPKRNKYSADFKREAVELVRSSGVSCREVALNIGVAPSLLTRWVRDEELVHLKRELARVTKECDFLRDAAAYFAKESSSTRKCSLDTKSTKYD